ncbi:MAG: hypothetical protein NTX73_11700 [Rhodobacterales bacterium]|nr:hypothetical protein [Rhodobacterales bacterium]
MWLDRREIDLRLVTTTALPAGTVATFELPVFWLISADRQSGSADLVAYPECCMFRRAMTQTLDAAGLHRRVAAQSPSLTGILVAMRSYVAVTAVVQGTAPDGPITRAEAEGLPPLPRLALHLVLSPSAPALGRPAAKRHKAHLDELCLI